MDAGYDVPDSTDWLQTPLRPFAELENALHCQICKEFYEIPMITSCNHTFCSRCIRTSLSSDGKCPACRASDQASKLRNNWAIQEVVDAFLAARPAALEVAKKAQEDEERPKRSGKRKRATVLDPDDVRDTEDMGRTTRSKSRRLNASQDSQPHSVVEVEDSESDGDFEPEQPVQDGLVECPLGCGKRMKIEAVEPHLDKCEDEKMQAKRTGSRTPLNGLSSPRVSSSQSTRPQDRIAELNYSMMKEAAMTKKLKDLGIPNWGGKPLMVSRHKEWVNIWNANCDSNHPRTKRDLLRDLDTWERTQGGHARPGNHQTNGVMRKDFDGAGWASQNKDEFSRLIADARRQKTNPAVAPAKLVNGAAAAPAKGVDDDVLPQIDGTQKTSRFFLDNLPRTVTGMSSTQQQSQQQDLDNVDMDHGNATADPRRATSATDKNKQPYANNPEALSSIRAKVASLNAGHHIEPSDNAGFRVPGLETRPSDGSISESNGGGGGGGGGGSGHPHTPSMFGRASESAPKNSRSPEPGRRGNSEQPSNDSPSWRQFGSPVKKVPMFALPQEPVTDVDQSSTG